MRYAASGRVLSLIYRSFCGKHITATSFVSLFDSPIGQVGQQPPLFYHKPPPLSIYGERSRTISHLLRVGGRISRSTLKMHQIRVRGLGIIIGWAALLLLNPGGEIKPALAQSACEPPEENEYLLLVVSQTSAEQKLVRRTLPGDIESEVCQYVDDVVTRVGGFEDRLIAEDWAAYLEDTVGLQAYIVKPGAAEELIGEEPDSEQRPPTQPAARQLSRSAFNPEILGPGYAVLVDYFNQPELAEQIRQTLDTEIGLVSYGQRPYLLIEYTRDAETAASTLKSLSRQGFWPMVVDSRRVTVIRPQLD